MYTSYAQMLENFSWITKVTLCLIYKHPHLLTHNSSSTILSPSNGLFQSHLKWALQVKKFRGFFLLLISTHVSLMWRLSWLCKKDEMWFNYSTALITHLGTVTINCTVQFINLHWILDLKKERCSQQDRVHVLFLLHVVRRPVVPDKPHLWWCSPVVGGSSDGGRGKYWKVYNLLLSRQTTSAAVKEGTFKWKSEGEGEYSEFCIQEISLFKH